MSEYDWRNYPIPPSRQPKCQLVDVTHHVPHSTGTDTYHYHFLRWNEGKPALWRIQDWRKDYVLLVDYTGETVPVNFAPNWDNERRIEEVLAFTDKYSSCADYAIKTIASWAVAILLSMRKTKGCTDLQILRIALQLWEELIQPGKPFSFDDLIARDPEKVKTSA